MIIPLFNTLTLYKDMVIFFRLFFKYQQPCIKQDRVLYKYILLLLWERQGITIGDKLARLIYPSSSPKESCQNF